MTEGYDLEPLVCIVRRVTLTVRLGIDLVLHYLPLQPAVHVWLSV